MADTVCPEYPVRVEDCACVVVSNTRSYNQTDANHTQVNVTDSQSNTVYRYKAGYDMNMSVTSITNGNVKGIVGETVICRNASVNSTALLCDSLRSGSMISSTSLGLCSSAVAFKSSSDIGFGNLLAS